MIVGVFDLSKIYGLQCEVKLKFLKSLHIKIKAKVKSLNANVSVRRNKKEKGSS